MADLAKLKKKAADLEAAKKLDKAIAAPSAESDRIFIKVEDAVESVSGITMALHDTELKAEVEGAERTILFMPRSLSSTRRICP